MCYNRKTGKVLINGKNSRVQSEHILKKQNFP